MGYAFLCKKCGNIKYNLLEDYNKCPYCNGNIERLNLSLNDVTGLSSEEKEEIRLAYQSIDKYDKFAWAQRKIRDKDLHETIQQESAQFKTSHPECPYCHNRNTKKITTASKALNTGMFGLFGTKRNYQWHCNNCGSDF